MLELGLELGSDRGEEEKGATPGMKILKSTQPALNLIVSTQVYI